MARVEFTALVASITGKLAGSVFQYSYGGFQVHTKGKPRNPQTDFQQLRRGDFGFLSASWRSLTLLQRQSFIDNAPAGISALNFFIQCNINLILVGSPTITTYTPTTVPDSLPIAPVEITNSVYKIRTTGIVTTVPVGTALAIFSTYQKEPTKVFTNPSEYSPITALPAGTDLSTAIDIIAAYNTRFGQIDPDKQICCKSALIDITNGNRTDTAPVCTITEDMAKFVKIFTDVSQPITTGTGNTTLSTFMIPANTLPNDGDIISGHLSGTSTATAGSGSLNLSFNGTGNLLTSSVGVNGWSVTLRIQRIDSNTAILTLQLTVGFTFVVISTVFDNAVNWAATINLLLIAQAPVAGAIIAESIDINKELQ